MVASRAGLGLGRSRCEIIVNCRVTSTLLRADGVNLSPCGCPPGSDVLLVLYIPLLHCCCRVARTCVSADVSEISKTLSTQAEQFKWSSKKLSLMVRWRRSRRAKSCDKEGGRGEGSFQRTGWEASHRNRRAARLFCVPGSLSVFLHATCFVSRISSRHKRFQVLGFLISTALRQ